MAICKKFITEEMSFSVTLEDIQHLTEFTSSEGTALMTQLSRTPASKYDTALCIFLTMHRTNALVILTAMLMVCGEVSPTDRMRHIFNLMDFDARTEISFDETVIYLLLSC